MTVIICLDERGGMTFMGRRQSRDEAVCKDIMHTVGDGRLYIQSYSGELFKGENIKIVQSPLSEAGPDDFCFIETEDITDHLCEAHTLITYNWNRHYPSDRLLDIKPEKHGFSMYERIDLAGKSHEKITKETYIK